MAGEHLAESRRFPLAVPVRALGLLGLGAVGLWLCGWLVVGVHTFLGSGVAVSFLHDPWSSWAVGVELRAVSWPVGWHVLYPDVRPVWWYGVVAGALVVVGLPVVLFAVAAAGLLRGRSPRWVGLLGGMTGWWVPAACVVTARWDGLSFVAAAGALWLDTAAIYLAASVTVVCLLSVRRSLWPVIRPRRGYLVMVVLVAVLWVFLRPDWESGPVLIVVGLAGAVAVPLCYGLGPPVPHTSMLLAGWLVVPALGLGCDMFGLVVLILGAPVLGVPPSSAWPVWPLVAGIAVETVVIMLVVRLLRRDRARAAVEEGAQ